MPLPQRNFNYFTYVSGDGTTYNIRAAEEWAAIAGHGLAAATVGAPLYVSTGRKKPRRARYVDPTTGRSVEGPVGTAAAHTALAIGTIQAFPVVGQAATVNYTLAAKPDEKIGGSVRQSFRPDHA
jgi:hypothetical protein